MKLKIPRLLARKKLWAATARRSVSGSAGMDYGEMSEPNMKLSRALLIVLLLHVVAVSGIIAFNAIKTRQISFVPAPLAANAESNPAARSVAPAINSDAPKPGAAVGPHNEAKTSRSPSRSNAKSEHPKSTEDDKAPTSSGKFYTVVKGDNPVTIAKKLKVSYDDLIALNQIADPRKMQIGQKLLIPKTTKPKAKKTN